MNKEELKQQAQEKGGDVNSFVLKKYKRMKTIAMINEAPESVALEVFVDTTSEIVFRARRITQEDLKNGKD